MIIFPFQKSPIDFQIDRDVFEHFPQFLARAANSAAVGLSDENESWAGIVADESYPPECWQFGT
jgi:hypothetical protein